MFETVAVGGFEALICVISWERCSYNIPLLSCFESRALAVKKRGKKGPLVC